MKIPGQLSVQINTQVLSSGRMVFTGHVSDSLRNPIGRHPLLRFLISPNMSRERYCQTPLPLPQLFRLNLDELGKELLQPFALWKGFEVRI